MWSQHNIRCVADYALFGVFQNSLLQIRQIQLDDFLAGQVGVYDADAVGGGPFSSMTSLPVRSASMTRMPSEVVRSVHEKTMAAVVRKMISRFI